MVVFRIESDYQMLVACQPVAALIMGFAIDSLSTRTPAWSAPANAPEQFFGANDFHKWPTLISSRIYRPDQMVGAVKFELTTF
jgi:hypothetical protein